MKTFAFILAALLSCQTALASADATPAPAPSSSPVVLTPASMLQLMIDPNKGNYSIAVGLNTLKQSKLSVAIARANLLPGGKLGAILKGGDPVSFAVNSLSVLLPFLVPSNWFAEKASSHMYVADMAAYYLLELNQYAEIYSQYETLVNDMTLEPVLQEQYDYLNQIATILQDRQNDIGAGPTTDSIQAAQAAKDALGQLQALQELILQENTYLVQSLGLAVDTPLVVDITAATAHVAPSQYEGQTATALLDLAISKAPEKTQIDALEAAAKDQKWSDVFAFINSFSLGTDSNNGSGSSSGTGTFGGMGFSGNVSFGLSTFPTVALDNEKTAAIELQRRNLSLTEGQTLSSSLGSIVLAENQLTTANDSYNLAYQVLQDKMDDFRDGLTDLLHVTDAQTKLTTAATTRVKAQADLDNLRINLHRAMITDQFDKLPQCDLQHKVKTKDSGPFGWIKDIFSRKTVDQSVDQMCRAAS